METEKYVNWTADALSMVADINDYLENVSGEDFASDYIDDLLDFGSNLSKKSEHNSYCRNSKLQEKKYRCVLFKKTYILIYKENDTDVVILAVIHQKRNPIIFEQIE
jgi:plasmid stabilization system protein ParE